MSATAADHPLTAALLLRDKQATQLGAGIVTKICASYMYEHGVTPVPVGESQVNGAKWRSIIDKAQLTESEVEFFLIWLEEAHGSAIYERSLQPLTASCSPSRTRRGPS